MPPGVGYVGGGQGFGSAPNPLAPSPVPQGPQEGDAMADIIAMLRGGQVGAEKFVELLAHLAASTLGQQGGGPQQQPQEQPQGQEAGGGASSITSLLGG